MKFTMAGCIGCSELRTLLVTLVTLALVMDNYSCYRIVEWKIENDETGSGSGSEDTSEIATKSKTNIATFNDIEKHQSTKSPHFPGGLDSSEQEIASNVGKSHKSLSSNLEALQRLNPGIKIFLFNPTKKPDSNKSKQQFKSCSRNEECNKGNTCNLYSKKCERCRFREEICRRDGNCCDGLKCLWGRCREPITNGTEKSLCKSNEDCHSGLCCAKEHGVSVCKRYQKEGDTCEIPLGGLVFSLHHSCPCEQGLRCKVNRRNSDEFRQTNGRCIK